MTLEDAKKEIKRRADAYYNCYKGWDKEKPEMRGSLNFLYSSNGLDEALEILDKVEPSGNPEQLTLKELARELRKVFKFRYLTVEKVRVRTHKTITLWAGNKPPFYSDKAHEWFALMSHDLAVAFTFELRFLNSYLDFSEYKDADGNIDYSKCIVEVE